MIDFSSPSQLSGFIAGLVGFYKLVERWRRWWDEKCDAEEETIRRYDADSYRETISADPILVSASEWAYLKEKVQQLESGIHALRDGNDRLAQAYQRIDGDAQVAAASHARLQTFVRIIAEKTGTNAPI